MMKARVPRKRAAAPAAAVTPDMPPERHRALMLRTCEADMTGYSGFAWPESGYVAAPDWKPTASCGNGLHGLLWGEGNGELLSWESTARWLVCVVDTREAVDLGQKVKGPEAWVVHCGDQRSATEYLLAHGAAGKAVVGSTATAGYGGTATAGDRGTATAGDSGTATAGDRGTATAGDRGTATAGDRGTATAGDSGTATAGYSGTATAGDRGMIVIEWWDPKREKWRRLIGEIGEDGLEAGIPYRVEVIDVGARFVRAEPTS